MTRPSPVPAVRSAYHAVLRRLPLRLRRQFLFAKGHGRLPDLRSPTSFNEKIQWRILHDRRPLLTGTCDKLSMKAYAQQVAGDELRIPRTYWHGVDLAELASLDVPGHWVLKPTHRSYAVIFGEGRPDPAALTARTQGWLDEVNWSRLGEWAYASARREYLLEERIGHPGSVPADYKFFVFDGVPRLIQVDRGRFGAHTRRFYTPHWEPLHNRSGLPLGDAVPRPAQLERMLELAGRLGEGFDFIRIDLYAEDGEIWFGETTPYDGSGLDPLDPTDLDYRLGAWWTLPTGAGIV